MLRTKAEPQADGSYSITGTKIFISAGEHDLTENIVHLVLARLPDAPGGTKGISLFIVPKFLPKADGSVGERNGIRCGALEHKMGIKANATCVMNLDGATGWLVGEANKGMAAMFVMMNAARLGVGMQGLGIAETAYQSAVAYARDRLQGRSLTGPKNASGPADPIIVHPDVRRMLMIQKSFTEGARALSLWVGMLIDEAHSHPDAATREAADDLIQMLTPIIKAYFTDMGSECANLAVQTWGGHGFIRENGVEQLVRDARITQLYEGTNGIQALDLIGRKLSQMGGKPADEFLARMKGLDKELAGADLATLRSGLADGVAALESATQWIRESMAKDADAAAAGATNYLKMFGVVAGGYTLARAAVAAQKGLGKGGDDAFLKAKIATARFYAEQILPQAAALLGPVTRGAALLYAIPVDELRV
jgi:alkylation response protein AidB-like acyl-CoA dehydrogenase